MRLSWNEIRARAANFAREFADETYEKGGTQTFYNAFFQIFGVKRRSVAVYERRVQKLSGNTGFIDLFWPQVLLVEQKSAGRNLSAARVQAEDYFLTLKENERPRYLLACDFQTFDLHDLSERTSVSFKLEDLPDHVERFGFIMGVQKVAFKDQDPVNVRAAELVGELHDKLEEAGFKGTDLEKFLVRIVFCLFADDTGVFQPRNLFLDWLEERTADDGHDLGAKLAELFQTLDTPEDARGALLDEDLAAFPYVNGDLFKGATRIPAFNAEMREALLASSRFDWSPISPAIFGSLFQSVMNKEERRKAGAHYTTEKNILKVINPLFMDGLRAEFARINNLKRGRDAELLAFQSRLASLNFLDPACGCGNFLIIAYRELRLLEIELVKALYTDVFNRPGLTRSDYQFSAASLSKVDVDQFHGIEIGEFPAEIASAAMWMMDHIMNNELSRTFGQNYARIPLKKSANIVHGDALELEWADVIAPDKCDYVMGNPPFIGAKMQSQLQREQVRDTARLGGSGGTLDFVAAWFLKAGEFVNAAPRPRGIAFVATNSITQGEQVAQLWPLLFERFGLEIAFAHRTFAWGSDARGKAHVHVVVLGLTKQLDEPEVKRLFSYSDVNGEPGETEHVAISAYLVGLSSKTNRQVVIAETNAPICEAPKVIIGSKPIDGGYLILENESEIESLNLSELQKSRMVRPYVGAQEFLQGKSRWILALQDIEPAELRDAPKVKERVALVRRYRLGEIGHKQRSSNNKQEPGISSAALAQTPTQFHVTVIPTTPFLALPEVSSERRQYAPFGWLKPPIIPSNKLKVTEHAELFHFSTLQSSMHMAWMRAVTGRMKSDYMYSVGVVYNTFPWPDLDDKAKALLNKAGQDILDARANHPGATLADLYDPDAMPPDLRKAHRANDLAVDRLYRKKPFESERERVEFLFARYEALRAPLMAKKGKK
ncbi:MAG: class I SAM-dependent DNA methyltransferase [Acidobacteria bacterium]|nr:class I SAM-dependent DNA methyltransferase [Acidobacteriota bacterium]